MDREVCWTAIAGSCVAKRRRSIRGTYDDGASCDAASTRAVQSSSSVTAQSGLAEAVRAINNLATAQVLKDTPSLIGANGLGRPKEFSGRKEDFQQWFKKTEAFSAGVIQESDMMLEWAAEQTTEITTELINREFLPTATNQERGVQNPGVCAAADAYGTHGSHEWRGK